MSGPTPAAGRGRLAQVIGARGGLAAPSPATSCPGCKTSPRSGRRIPGPVACQTTAPATPPSRSRYTPTSSGSPHKPSGRTAPATTPRRAATHWAPAGHRIRDRKGDAMTDRSTPPALATALAYHQAWTSQNLDQAMTYIADDITCDAPGARISGAQQYRDFLGGFMTQLTSSRPWPPSVTTPPPCCAVLLPAHRQRQRRTHRRVLYRHRREDHPQRVRL
jgi:hypothetical protein